MPASNTPPAHPQQTGGVRRLSAPPPQHPSAGSVPGRWVKPLNVVQQATLDRDMRPMIARLEQGLLSLPAHLHDAALSAAVRARRQKAVELLLRAGADPNARDAEGRTPLYWAAGLDQPDIAKVLLQAGAKPEGTPSAPPIAHAVENKRSEMVQLLIEAGATTSIRDGSGPTLLQIAISGGEYSVIKQLLDTGLPLNGSGHEGRTVLHTAAVVRNTPALQSLIRLGADPNARADDGMTPALDAASSGFLVGFEHLVKAGADPLAHDSKGLNALTWSLGCSRDEMGAYLLQNHPTLATMAVGLDKHLLMAVLGGCTACVNLLAAMGADLKQQPGGKTLLQVAKSEEVKRVLRSLDTTALIESAMDDPDEPPGAAPKPSLPSL